MREDSWNWIVVATIFVALTFSARLAQASSAGRGPEVFEADGRLFRCPLRFSTDRRDCGRPASI